ncbi:MAG: GNAT family N-acetyltransferase [Oscillospiraceae bacterium]|jgi:ribosomal protein S18 acetylase RimI-like enzyme|nr:GNAT family N-acetyltransferase [Oscillospiraceae bacterium]
MTIRFAVPSDLPAWFALATEASPIFRHPADMGDDPDFIAYARSKTGKNEALTAVDETGSHMGFIGFSHNNNRITWFGVFADHRRKGVGEALLTKALAELDHSKPITVETYPEGYVPGVPAKRLYRKAGFTETESGLVGPHGLTVCRMTLQSK